MVHPQTASIEGITGQFQLAEDLYNETLAAYNEASDIFSYWEGQVMNYMLLHDMEEITIETDTYRIVGIHLQKTSTTFVTPSPTAPIL